MSRLMRRLTQPQAQHRRDSSGSFSENKNVSVVEAAQSSTEKEGGFGLFAMKKKNRKPRRRNKILTPKQVGQLADMNSVQITNNHSYQELEFIVQSLRNLFTARYKAQSTSQAELTQNADSDKALGAAEADSERPKKRMTKKKNKKSRFSTFRGKRPSVLGAVAKPIFNFAKRKTLIAAAESKPESENPYEALDVAVLMTYNEFLIDNALEKTEEALRNNKINKDKQRAMWRAWDEDQRDRNLAALIELRGLIPKSVRLMDEENLTERLDGNQYLAKRLVRNKALHMFHMTFDEIQRFHPADFNNRFEFSQLDLRELRALYCHTKGLRREWRTRLREKLFYLTEKEAKGELEDREVISPAYFNEPNFSEEPTPAVAAFLKKKRESIYDPKAQTSLAKELQETVGQDGSLGPAAPSEVRKRSIDRRNSVSRPEPMNPIYFNKRPNSGVKRNSHNAAAGSVHMKESSDEEKKKDAKPLNIFVEPENTGSLFEEIEYASADESDDDDYFSLEFVDKEEVKSEMPKQKRKTRVASGRKDSKGSQAFEEFIATEGDNDEDVQRKQAGLMQIVMNADGGDEVVDEAIRQIKRNKTLVTKKSQGKKPKRANESSGWLVVDEEESDDDNELKLELTTPNDFLKPDNKLEKMSNVYLKPKRSYAPSHPKKDI